MNKVLKVFGLTVLAFVVILGAGWIYFESSFPKVKPAGNITIKATPARLERGRYLANHVAACVHCHSKRNWKYYTGPVVSGTEGMGGEPFDKKLGIYGRNITPAHIGDYTDGQLVRVIRTGVTNTGEALFPIMPYQGYAKMSREDLYSVIAYIKTLKPIQNEVPGRHLGFPLNLIVKTIPKDSPFQPAPAPSDTLAYGKYLVSIAGCVDCHTPMKKGKFVQGMEFAGGTEFNIPHTGIIRSANITPDRTTGIGNWDKLTFIERFKMYNSPESRRIPVSEGSMQTVMPWTDFAGMTREDLGAIYTYLRTLKPIKHNMIRFVPVAETKEAN